MSKMQEHEVRALFDRLIEAMDPALEYDARHEDFTVELPQSGERMDRDGLRKLQEHFPSGAPTIRLRRLTGGGDIWTGETVIHYTDGKVVHGVGVIEFRDGKIWKETRYYAEPFEAPAWRSEWVERIEEPVAG
jgi:SnoaL-like domain